MGLWMGLGGMMMGKMGGKGILLHSCKVAWLASVPAVVPF